MKTDINTKKVPGWISWPLILTMIGLTGLFLYKFLTR